LIFLPILAVVSGILAWSSEPRLLPVAFLFPALWAFAPSRFGAALVSAGYFLAASRGLLQGVANYYGGGFAAAIGLWFGAASAFVFVHGALWTVRPGGGKALRYALAAVLMAVPPFGIVGWAHPITAAGAVFPGGGWWGLLAAAIGLLAMTTKRWPIAILTLGGFWIWSAATWTVPMLPEGWIGVETRFGGSTGEYAGYRQQLETIDLVRAAADGGAKVVVLPEGAAGAWTPTVERMWHKALSNVEVSVIAGAIIVTEAGYDNVLLDITELGASVLYRQRVPVPVSMWQPWQRHAGESGGARAYFFSNPVVDFGGLRAAPLICYEQLLIWPILQSALFSPDVIVAVGNGWWTANTNIVAIQTEAVEAWARLFSVPPLESFNT